MRLRLKEHYMQVEVNAANREASIEESALAALFSG